MNTFGVICNDHMFALVIMLQVHHTKSYAFALNLVDGLSETSFMNFFVYSLFAVCRLV